MYRLIMSRKQEFLCGFSEPNFQGQAVVSDKVLFLQEKVVLDGHGQKLLHETSALDKVSKFIFTLPDFMVRKIAIGFSFRNRI